MRTYKTFLILILVTIVNAEHPQEDDFVCSERGRFADENDSTCRHYHFCVSSYRGEWVKSSYDCPNGTIFDKDARHCSSNTKCHHDDSDYSVSSSDYDDDEFECRRPGLFDDVQDATCSKYYKCETNRHGELGAVQYPCPPPSRFDPKQKHCSNHYVCPRHFRCSHVGRFEDATDDNNKRYFLCVKRKNGEFSQTVYSCPLYSRFDHIDNVCVIPDESLSDEYNVHDHTLPNENWDHLSSFVCHARGFFSNSEDRSCKSFYFCDVNADGSISKYILWCPNDYGWNADINLCSKGYSR